MRKVQDYYFKKAKLEKYPARSVYKLEQVQKKYQFLKKGDAVLDLGCQPGSWTVYAAENTGPAGLVVGVDLTDGVIAARPGSARICQICGDVMDPGLLDSISEVRKEFRVVLSDMAPATSGYKWVDQQRSLALAMRVLEVAEQVLLAGGYLYCKVFEGEDFPEFVKTVKKKFDMVKVVKPASSRSESREVFVYGAGYRKG